MLTLAVFSAALASWRLVQTVTYAAVIRLSGYYYSSYLGPRILVVVSLLGLYSPFHDQCRYCAVSKLITVTQYKPMQDDNEVS